MCRAVKRFTRWSCGLCGLGLLLAGPGGAQTFFAEVTELSGLSSLQSGNIAFGDYDNDGWPDMVSAGIWPLTKDVVLLHNEGNGRFSGRSIDVRGDAIAQWKGWGVAWADYDNDGDLDLYLPVGAEQSLFSSRDVLLRNDQGLFADVTLAAGLTDVLPSGAAIWFDYNLDGHLDLFVRHDDATGKEPLPFNSLYKSNGDGTFADMTEEAGLDVILSPGRGGGDTGTVAADFNNDGRPDLYIATSRSANRLFVNTEDGIFIDATTGEIADRGQTFQTAVGDIDNDGDLDIFQTAGGGAITDSVDFRSLMLLNLGENQFLDVTEGVGLSALTAENLEGAGLADIDNDGALDLITAFPHFLFLNNGEGFFVDRTAESGKENGRFGLVLGDVDLDGFIDVVFNDSNPLGNGKFGGLYRNNGNDNHWLRVELAGARSNRNGIGARLKAVAGDLSQIREIFGGLGFGQDEMVAHFGLGARAQIDRLEIHWPSGTVDILTDIPVDQKIRVIEGSGAYCAVRPTVWAPAPPDSLVASSSVRWQFGVRPALFEAGAEIVGATADLSALGGPSAVSLVEMDDGRLQLEPLDLEVVDDNGIKEITVAIEQSTSLGPYWTRLSRTAVVLPAKDQLVLQGGTAGGWGPPAGEKGRDRLSFLSFGDGAPEIFAIDADGTNRVRLTHGQGGIRVLSKNSGLFKPNIAWSPDGSQLAFSGDIDGVRAIYAVAADGTGRRRLTDPMDPETDIDTQPAWSPDGSWIAFSSNRESPEEFDIFAMNADGSNAVNLTGTPGDDGEPAWSPDGSQIAFSSNREGGSSQIFVMAADGSNPVNLTPDGDGAYPAWSPDGTKLAFVSAREGPLKIFAMAADGGNPVALSRGATGFDRSPAWSPDGRKIAYVEVRSILGQGEIVVVNADGSDPVRLTLGSNNQIPRWLPAGGSPPLVELNKDASSALFEARSALELKTEGAWMATWVPAAPMSPIGYDSLHFFFHPGDAMLPEQGWLKVRVGEGLLDLRTEMGVDFSSRIWQEVSLPLSAFALNPDRPIEVVRLLGKLEGTAYLADVRLVAVAGEAPITAVVEERVKERLQHFALEQNFPNPFNPETTIRFALVQGEKIELAVYNLVGQKVATLAADVRQAGTYVLRWDGRDDAGRQLASGVYLYRLQAGRGMVETRKLVLVR